MAQVLPLQKQVVRANGTQLYCEIRGQGPTILFIPGATGDAGHFEQVAHLLADEFTVITYDRRGNSRSPKPIGWTETSMQEQANDAAGLISALGVAPVGVFGTSGGGNIALELVLRHPDLMRGVVIHEPSVMQALGEQLPAVMAQLQATMDAAMAEGGPRKAQEYFVRWAAGDATFEGLAPELRERMLGNAETFFGIELAAFTDYRPDNAAVAAIQRPVRVLLSRETAAALPYQPAICDWLASLVRTEVGALPGAHACYLSHPVETAAELRRYLKEILRT